MELTLFIFIILPVNLFLAFFVYRYFILRFSLFNHSATVLRLMRFLCYFMGVSLPLAFLFGRMYYVAPLSFLFNFLFGLLFLLFVASFPIFIFLPLFTKLPNRMRLLLEGRESLYLSFSLFFILCSFSLGLLAPSIESTTISINRLPMKELKIVQLSDMHIGPILRDSFVEDVVQKVNGLNPDIVVITGDLIDQKVDMLIPPLDALAKLKARLGVYFCLGNHEYYAGDIPRLLVELRNRKITPLVNEGIVLGDSDHRINLIAVADQMGKRFADYQPNLEKTLAAIDPAYPTILLSHHPVDPASLVGKVDLILSGHTHGGQVMPFDLPVLMVHHFLEGLYRSHDTYLYVNRGTGFWGPPIRFPRGGEITELLLRSN